VPAAAGEPAAVAPLLSEPADAGGAAAGGGEAGALYEQGLRAYALGHTEEAVGLWKKCLEKDPGNERAQKALEHAQRELDMSDKETPKIP
jgi:hypothetical protein